MNMPLLRFDMSEYQEKHSVAKFIGAPPGYVGYEENAGQLITKLQETPNCILLLDEIEKAHQDVTNVLLQFMDKNSEQDLSSYQKMHVAPNSTNVSGNAHRA